ncbi:hypothetical protein, partial [Microcoleus anatoxicus]
MQWAFPVTVMQSWFKGDRVFCGWAIGFLVDGRSNWKSSAVGIPAVGNRVLSNDVRLRGRRGYLEMENHRVKSSTRGGGFCLCRRGFNRRGFWVSTAEFFVDGRSGFWLMGDRIFCGWAIGFLGRFGRSNLKSSAVG